MGRLLFRNLLSGMITMFISITAAALILSLLCLFAKLLDFQFRVIPMYISGALISLIACFILRKFFVEKNSYFVQQDIDSKKKSGFWVDRIRQKKFMKKKWAIMTYVPSFVISLSAIVLAVLLYPKLQKAESYVGVAAICAAIGAAVISWLLYGILGIKSIEVCKNCGSVNAFVYDEDLEFSIATGYKGLNAYGRTWGDGGIGFDVRKVTKFGNRISRHCACCGEKSVYMDTGINSDILQ